MSTRQTRLEETARVLRARLKSLSAETPPPHRRPMHDVALDAVRGQLTDVGHQLARMVA